METNENEVKAAWSKAGDGKGGWVIMTLWQALTALARRVDAAEADIAELKKGLTR